MFAGPLIGTKNMADEDGGQKQLSQKVAATPDTLRHGHTTQSPELEAVITTIPDFH